MKRDYLGFLVGLILIATVIIWFIILFHIIKGDKEKIESCEEQCFPNQIERIGKDCYCKIDENTLKKSGD